MSLAKVKKIEIPVSVFETAETKEELEDWLLAHDPNFIKRMRKAQKEFAEGKGRDLETIKKELCIK